MTIRPSAPKTMLDRVRPTVVRRRVYEPPPNVPANVPGAQTSHDDDDDEGPPSSVNVARALASLRGHELQRLEEILGAHDDEEDEVAPPALAEASEPPAPSVPHVRVGPSIAVAELARRMSVPIQELVTALVTRGFFSVTVKSTLPRETARAAATLFDWEVEDADEVEPSAKKQAATRAAAPKGKAKTKTKAKAKATTKTPAKKRSAATKAPRRTSRRA